MSLEDKKREVELLHQELSGTPHAILVDFRGLDVAGATDLRRRLHDQDAKFRVVKNTIALRAIEDLPLADLGAAFEGQTAIAYTGGDIVVLAKTLREFANEFETPTFKAGVVDGEPISVEEFDTIAQLPSREELVGKAVYLLQYPVSGLVTALSGIVRGLVVALGQIQDKKEAGELPAGEPESSEDEVAAAPPEEPEDEAGATAAAEAGGQEPEEPAATDEPEAAGEGDAEAAGDGDAEAAEAGDEDDEAAAEAAAEDDEDEDDPAGAEAAGTPEEKKAEELEAEAPDDESTGEDEEEEEATKE